jgi:NAD(P)-dependent dehydrogenase (short-subunit alcohol dehydrogenase family)
MWSFKGMPKRTQPRSILVTGAAQGIGAAIARQAAAAGHRVALADIQYAGVQALAAEIGQPSLALGLDITDAAAWERALDEVEREFGQLDVLINNAAVVHVGRAENVSMRGHQQTIDVNFMGPLKGMLAALPRFKAQGHGHFVTVCSMTAFLPFPGLASYAASKHALRAFHHALALEERGAPLNFTIVHPTSTETPMLEQEAASDEAPLCFSGPSVTPEFVAGVVLDAMNRRKIEVFMPPERARMVRMVGTNPRSLRALVEQGEAAGAQNLQRRRASR